MSDLQFKPIEQNQLGIILNRYQMALEAIGCLKYSADDPTGSFYNAQIIAKQALHTLSESKDGER